MADTDNSSYITRYNLVLLRPEYFAGADWYPQATPSAISALLTGYVSGAGTISATDSVLSAIQKLNGNIVAAPGVSVLTADPSAPTEGQVWYNSTTHLLKYRDNSVTKVVATV